MKTYSKEELTNILDQHKQWLEDNNKGSKANLSGANLSGAILSNANLSEAYLRGANLPNADLSNADLRGANLRDANLPEANLSGANLRGANLSNADLSDANLSGSKGLLNPSEWLLNNFQSNEKGIIVYKGFGNTTYKSPNNWKIKEGSQLTETVNRNATEDCGCGINFGTLNLIKKNYPKSIIWKCLIEWIDLANVVVPYNTDGKARCGKLKLIRKATEQNKEIKNDN
jgi:uncharacterized protein YjbI with pentapeptide repeats